MRAAPRSLTPTIHVSYVGAVGRYLHRRGLDPRTLYARLGLSSASIEDGQARVPLRDFFALLEAASEQAGDPHLGLHVYEQFDLADLGVLGFALLSAQDVGMALRTLVRYGKTFQDCEEGQLLIERDHACMWYRVSAPGLELSRHDCDMTTAFTVAFLRKVLGPQWSPVSVQLQHPLPAPQLRSEYERIFACPLTFAAAINQVTFQSRILETPIRSCDRRLFDIIERNLRLLQEQSRLESPLAQRVEAAIAHHLGAGPPTVGGIAKALRLSPRALQRDLAAHSLKFNELLDKARRGLATRLLATSEHSLTEITWLLGYSQESAFLRAFRRWMGCTPNDYRRAARGMSRR